ncbi:MAG: prephenate dehydrogenase/arogenate dehydrogenase family protein, partial [Pseudomonadota bacterium]
RAIRRADRNMLICAHDHHLRTIEAVREYGLCDHIALDAAEAAKGADLIVLCTPFSAFEELCTQLAPAVEAGAIISDVASMKLPVVTLFERLLPDHVHKIPAHPVAGTEHSGVGAGFAELFDNRFCIITPADHGEIQPVARLRDFWQMLGAEVEVMDAKAHDQILAVTSHLPHLLAYALVGTAAGFEVEYNTSSPTHPKAGSDARAEQAEAVSPGIIKFSAGGFRDFTRIASSSPIMWRDVFLHNREPVLNLLERFEHDLDRLKQAIIRGDGTMLLEWFTHTRKLRQSVVRMGQAGRFVPTETESKDQ